MPSQILMLIRILRHPLRLTALRLALVNVDESLGGSGQYFSNRLSIFLRPEGAKHGAVFAIMVQVF
jgi:hypothetical protein